PTGQPWTGPPPPGLWQPAVPPGSPPGRLPWPAAGHHPAQTVGPGTPPRPSTPAVGGPRVGDLVVVLVLSAIFVLPSFALALGAHHPVSLLAGTAASIAMPVALYWRRTHPVRSAVVVYVAALVHFVCGVPLMPADVLIFVALYSVTVYGPVWAGRAALGGALLGSLLQGLALVSSGPDGPSVAGGLVPAHPLSPVRADGAVGAGRAARGGALLGSLLRGLALVSSGPDGPSVDWGLVRATLLSVVYAAFLLAVVCLLVWALGLLRRSGLAHTE